MTSILSPSMFNVQCDDVSKIQKMGKMQRCKDEQMSIKKILVPASCFFYLLKLFQLHALSFLRALFSRKIEINQENHIQNSNIILTPIT
jgi:hypothetical protein